MRNSSREVSQHPQQQVCHMRKTCLNLLGAKNKIIFHFYSNPNIRNWSMQASGKRKSSKNDLLLWTYTGTKFYTVIFISSDCGESSRSLAFFLKNISSGAFPTFFPHLRIENSNITVQFLGAGDQGKIVFFSCKHRERAVKSLIAVVSGHITGVDILRLKIDCARFHWNRIFQN